MKMFFRKNHAIGRRTRALAFRTLGVMLMVSMLLCTAYAAQGDAGSIRIIAVDDLNDKALSGTDITLSEKIDGNYHAISDMTDIDVSREGVELELPFGEYCITVGDMPNEYLTSDVPVEFEVTGEGVAIINAENAEISEGDDGSFVITVYLAKDYNCMAVMPSTGGVGTVPFTFVGIMLMSAAVIGGVSLARGKPSRS